MKALQPDSLLDHRPGRWPQQKQETPINILFVGNSFTYFWNMHIPKIGKTIAHKQDIDRRFLFLLRPASWAMIKKRVRLKRFHGTSRGWLLTLIVLCTSFPRLRRRRSRPPTTASAKPRVHNTPDRQITLGRAMSLHCNGSWMSAVLGLSALL